jgi:hypothetical protein
MPTSAGGLGRKLVDRAETVAGRDWDTVKRVAREEARAYGYRGSSKKPSKARKPSTRSGGR